MSNEMEKGYFYWGEKKFFLITWDICTGQKLGNASYINYTK